LKDIAAMPNENDEWDGADKYQDARGLAKAAIAKHGSKSDA